MHAAVPKNTPITGLDCLWQLTTFKLSAIRSLPLSMLPATQMLLTEEKQVLQSNSMRNYLLCACSGILLNQKSWHQQQKHSLVRKVAGPLTVQPKTINGRPKIAYRNEDP